MESQHPTDHGPPADPVAAERGLRAGRRTSREETRRLVDGVLEGGVDEGAFGRWLLALADVGESAEEIAGAADALRARMLTVPRAAGIVADTCGTGGDGSGSFNISTAAGLVVAAAGLPVAKHGNRAVSSRTGSADVLERLGVRVDLSPAAAGACLDALGFCFCLAPVHHPVMARLGPLRRSLGRPSVFNLVGPLCNPAAATVQVIGVGRPAAREPLARAAALLGAHRALVVSGRPPAGTASSGFDEVSLFGPTDVLDVAGGTITPRTWTAEDFGLPPCPADRAGGLAAAGPDESAAAIRGVLAGRPGPQRDVVTVNAAAVLWAAGRADSPAAARGRAEAAIDSGEAARLLEALVEFGRSRTAETA